MNQSQTDQNNTLSQGGNNEDISNYNTPCYSLLDENSCNNNVKSGLEQPILSNKANSKKINTVQSTLETEIDIKKLSDIQEQYQASSQIEETQLKNQPEFDDLDEEFYNVPSDEPVSYHKFHNTNNMKYVKKSSEKTKNDEIKEKNQNKQEYFGIQQMRQQFMKNTIEFEQNKDQNQDKNQAFQSLSLQDNNINSNKGRILDYEMTMQNQNTNYNTEYNNNLNFEKEWQEQQELEQQLQQEQEQQLLQQEQEQEKQLQQQYQYQQQQDENQLFQQQLELEYKEQQALHENKIQNQSGDDSNNEENEEKKKDTKGPPVEIKIDEEKKKKQFLILIENIEVYFPYKPYKEQIEYMKHVILSLNHKQNALLQSPTGTGKTLCLLCASLAWLVQKRKNQLENKEKIAATLIYSSRTHTQLRQVIKELKKTVYKVRTVTLGSRDQYCINPSLSYYSSLIKNSQCKKMCKEGSCTYFNTFKQQEKKLEKEFISNFDKLKLRDEDNDIDKVGNIMDIEDLKERGQQEGFCPYYYTSLIKNQADIAFLPYNYLLSPNRMPHFQLELENSSVIFDEAHNLPSVSEEGASCLLESVHLESALEELSGLKKYKFKWEMVMNFVQQFLSYMQNMLRDRQRVRKLGSGDMGFVVEGREIFKILEQFQFSDDNNNNNRQQQKGLQAANKNQQGYKGFANKGLYFKDLYTKRKKGVQSQQLQGIGNKKQQQQQSQPMKNTLANYGFFKAKNETQSQKQDKIEQFSLQYLKKYMFELGKCLEILSTSKDWGTDNWAMFLGCVQDLLTCDLQYPENDKRNITNLVNHYRLVFLVQNEQEKSFSIELMCLDPSISFKKIQEKKIHNLILTSGTLSPFNFWDLEFKTPFQVKLSGQHVINPQESLNANIVCQGPSKTLLDFSYKQRENTEIYTELGRTLLGLSKVIPEGILVIFGSYSLRDKCKELWLKEKLYWEINKVKQIFFEPKKNQKETQEVMQQYESKIKQGKGALMLAVNRGKLSEGYDFPDGLCRGVFLVGIPFPPVMDIKVDQKKRYLDCMGGSMKGNDWYLQQATRASNQAIGRVIRHIDDYGSIFMCDIRYNRNDQKQQISGWIRENLVAWNDYEGMKRNVERFFNKKTNNNNNYNNNNNGLSVQQQLQDIVSRNKLDQILNQDKEKQQKVKQQFQFNKKKSPQQQQQKPELNISFQERIKQKFNQNLLQNRNNIEQQQDNNNINEEEEQEYYNQGLQNQQPSMQMQEEFQFQNQEEEGEEGDEKESKVLLRTSMQSLQSSEKLQKFSKKSSEKESPSAFEQNLQNNTQQIKQNVNQGLQLRGTVQTFKRPSSSITQQIYNGNEKKMVLEQKNTQFQDLQKKNLDLLNQNFQSEQQQEQQQQVQQVQQQQESEEEESNKQIQQKVVQLKDQKFQKGKVRLINSSFNSQKLGNLIGGAGSRRSSKKIIVIDESQSQSRHSLQEKQGEYQDINKSNINSSNVNTGGNGKSVRCCICWESKSVLYESSHCHHKACLGCWENWLQNKLECPMCRERVRKKYLKQVDINMCSQFTQ